MDFIEFDTDYMPHLSDVELNKSNGEDTKFAIIEFVTVKESNDPNIHIVTSDYIESKEVKELIDKGICRVIGGGICTKSIAELMYGLQHTTRIMYKHTIQEAFKKFQTDDGFIRTTFNNIDKEDGV